MELKSSVIHSGLRDYRPGREHHAHPLLQEITGCMDVVGGDLACLKWDDAGGWLPKKLTAWTKECPDIPEMGYFLLEARGDRGLQI